MLSASWLYCLEEPEPFEEGNENNKKIARRVVVEIRSYYL